MRNYEFDTLQRYLAVNSREDMIWASVPLEEGVRCCHRGVFLMTDSKNASGQLPKRVNTNRKGLNTNRWVRSSGRSDHWAQGIRSKRVTAYLTCDTSSARRLPSLTGHSQLFSLTLVTHARQNKHSKPNFVASTIQLLLHFKFIIH